MALTLLKAGREEEAREHQRIYLDGLVGVMLAQADRLGAAGEIEEAGKVYIAILEGNPDHPLAKERLARIIQFLSEKKKRR